jgi:hypothetical protein
MKYSRCHRRGMTLVEVIVSTCVFLMAVVGILYSFVKCIELNEIGRESTIAVVGVKNKLEEIKSVNIASIFTTYDNTTFTITGLNGKGVIYVDNSNSRLLEVKVVFCWRLMGGRIVGEDTNLNGVLNTGEDKNGNGQIDSNVQIVTRIYG